VNVATGAMFGLLQSYIVRESKVCRLKYFIRAAKGLLPTLVGMFDQLSAGLEKKRLRRQRGNHRSLECSTQGVAGMVKGQSDGQRHRPRARQSSISSKGQ
jgi:hypothetical protein